MGILSFAAGQVNNRKRRPASKQNPCPICQHDDWCLVHPDGLDAICMRIGQGATKVIPFADGNEGYLHQLTGATAGWIHPSHLRTPATTPPRPQRNWSDLARKFADLAKAGAQVKVLSGLLGVTVESLTKLGTGHGRLDGRDVWTFPERDGAGQVVGIMGRPVGTGKKKRGRGSTSALSYADDWATPAGPVLLVEGASDTAAGISMGLAVVGRPSNRGGVPMLAELLADIPPDRPIIVVGEDDRKDDGRWPGRDGAVSTAEKLAAELRRTVAWSMPPDEAKDTRTWLNGLPDDDLAALGRIYADKLLQGATIVEPPPAAPYETYQPPTAKVVSLDDWRGQMAAARLSSVGSQGVYFDGSPTGTGKSYADRAALVEAESSLTILPTHTNCRELAAELNEAGIEAVAYPQLTDENCQNIEAANRALGLGLPIAATACIGCEYREGCEYHAQMAEARKAPHAIATHERAARKFDSLAKGKHYVAVHENAEALLRPTAMIHERDLAGIAQVAAEARFNEQNKKRNVDIELVEFLTELQLVADEYLPGEFDRAGSTTKVDIHRQVKRPERLELKLYRAFHRGMAFETSGKPVINAEALRVCIGIVTGELKSFTIAVNHPKGEGGQVQTMKSLVAVWQTKLPSRMPVWFADATGSCELVSNLSEVEVTDATPAGRLDNQVPVMQLPRDITRGQSAETVAALLLGVLADHPEAQRVGIIGHQPHIKKLVEGRQPLLDDATRQRINRWCYFGEGPDRSSNDWHHGCDLLVVLGTPRVGVDAIRERLIRAGEDEAASIESPAWGERRWQGITTTGDLADIKGRGYLDDRWHQAHRDQVQAGLLQSIGRGRTILADGVPVAVLSVESLGIPVASASDISRVSKQVQAAAKAVSQCCVSPKRTHLGKTQLTLGGVRTAAIADRLGVSRSRAYRLLADAAEAGLVVRDDRSKGGWHHPSEAPAGASEGSSEAEERAAIIEFDAGLPRERAEATAGLVAVGPSEPSSPPRGRPRPHQTRPHRTEKQPAPPNRADQAAAVAAGIPGVQVAAEMMADST